MAAHFGSPSAGNPRAEQRAHDRFPHGTCPTPRMGFVGNIEFVADPAGSTIDARSASRLGDRDLDVYRKRIESVRAAFPEVAA